jgi:hypothetical protein
MVPPVHLLQLSTIGHPMSVAKHPSSRDKMFALPPPSSLFPATTMPPIFTPDRSWDFHRPAVPSPLSSSPIRASHSQSSPLSPIDENARLGSRRDVNSSPISSSFQNQKSQFRFASRPTRRNPVLRKREDAAEGRRNAFLQSVRQRGSDASWARRDVETTVRFFLPAAACRTRDTKLTMTPCRS